MKSSILTRPPQFHSQLVITCAFVALFYFFFRYALRSSLSVMVPELTQDFNLTALGLSSMVGLYFFAYAALTIVSGALLERYGAKYVVLASILMLVVGAVLFGPGLAPVAEGDHLLKGAWLVFVFTSAVFSVVNIHTCLKLC